MTFVISLVGPPNKLVARAIEVVQSRGIAVVAAVGNDGPAAPAQYPASYPGVLAVTAVDAGGLKNARYLEPLAGLNIYFGYGAGKGTAIAPRWIGLE